MYLDENYEKLVRVMADARRSINWNQIDPRTGHEFFASRIRSAGREPTFRRALEKLGRKVGTRCISTDPELVTELDSVENREQTLTRMREESMYLALLAAEYYRRDRSQTTLEAIR